MHVRKAVSPLTALLLLAGVARADVVTTKSGVALEGEARRAADGRWIVTTEGGEVSLAAEDVTNVVPGDGPRTTARKQVAALAKDDVAGRYRLALRNEAAGAAGAAAELFAQVVALDPDHAAARRALGFEKADGKWVPLAQARRHAGLVLFDGRWLLPVEAEAAARAAAPAAPKDRSLVSAMRVAAAGAAARRGSTEELIASAAGRDVLVAPDAARVEAATALLLDRDPVVRTWAATRLGEWGDERALRPLITSSVRDRDTKVREAAVAAVASFGHDDAAIPYVRALDSEHLGVVANAAQALAGLGDARAVRYIVRRVTSHGGGPRVFVSFLTQTSYIRDFDVEVAQSSNIADPVVGVIQEGAVLDIHVLDASIETTTIEPVLVDAFNRLTGAKAKTRDELRSWWIAHGDETGDFPRAPASRTSGR